MARSSTRISVVIFQERDLWVAQCLEYDITAQAESMKELIEYELGRVLVGHISVSLETGRRPFENLPPAPQRYWALWNDAVEVKDGKVLPFRAPSEALSYPEPALRIAA